MVDRERRGNAAEVYEALLAEVSRYCYEHATELVEVGEPVRLVVETDERLAADRGFRANVQDAVAQIVRVSLGTALVAADVVGGEGLAGTEYRLLTPDSGRAPEVPVTPAPPPPPPPPPAGPPPPEARETPERFTVPRSPAPPVPRARFSQPTTTVLGSSGPLTVPGDDLPPPAGPATAPSDPPGAAGAADAVALLPPIPQLGPDLSPRALSGQRTIRFSYGVGPGPSWLFTLRPAPVWVPLGRRVGSPADSVPVMDLSLLRSIPSGRLLFLCYWQGRAHLLRTGARPDYLIALDTLVLATDGIVRLPHDGILRWRHRTKPGESVLQYTISAEEAR
ncbi:hypothetical protein [Cryptosporangium sp. NPDC051539]|uniref:hypothetical protein n=1 Tax=Cryptosporangium sp. NPDC051539 TaxID=3363962 RepID=UPI0037A9D5AF